MVDWPSTLPQWLERDGFNEQEMDGVLHTSMETGAPKARPRYTATVVNITGMLKLTRADYDTLKAFYTANRATPFNWIHPVTGDPASMRFKSPPAYTSAGAEFRAQLSLEILP